MDFEGELRQRPRWRHATTELDDFAIVSYRTQRLPSRLFISTSIRHRSAFARLVFHAREPIPQEVKAGFEHVVSQRLRLG
jgi:hypothetical protein